MIELRNFEGTDFYAWQGANDFVDGSNPLIAEGKEGIMIVCGSESRDGTAIIEFFFGDDGDKWAFKSIKNKDYAIKDAKVLTGLLDEEFDPTQLDRLGFTVIY